MRVFSTFPLLQRAGATGWRFLAACLAVCVVLLTSPATLHGQALSSITGTVTDATGGVMPNVKITVTNTATLVASHSVTNRRRDAQCKDNGDEYGDPSGKPLGHQLFRHVHRHGPDSRRVHRASRGPWLSDVRAQRGLGRGGASLHRGRIDADWQRLAERRSPGNRDHSEYHSAGTRHHH